MNNNIYIKQILDQYFMIFGRESSSRPHEVAREKSTVTGLNGGKLTQLKGGQTVALLTILYTTY